MENQELEKRIRSRNDAELIEVLKLRDSYTPEAVEFAIDEALVRGLIASTEDLKLPRFQTDESSRKSLFPYLHEEKQFVRVFSSLTRLLYLIAVLPLIVGVLKLTDLHVVNAVSFLIIGGTWLLLSILTAKKKDPRLPLLLILVFFAGLALTLSDTYLLARLKLDDFVVIGIAVVVVLYVLLYLKLLLARRKRKEEISS